MLQLSRNVRWNFLITFWAALRPAKRHDMKRVAANLGGGGGGSPCAPLLLWKNQHIYTQQDTQPPYHSSALQKNTAKAFVVATFSSAAKFPLRCCGTAPTVVEGKHASFYFIFSPPASVFLCLSSSTSFLWVFAPCPLVTG